MDAAAILLLLNLHAVLCKYVYVGDRMTWRDAQTYCRTFHTDLAPVANAEDIRRLWQLLGSDRDYAWIGLERDPADRDKWTWSGGGEVSTFFWAHDQPRNRWNENNGLIYHSKWHDADGGLKQPFFCYSAVVVREPKTWEEALEHCRGRHRDLASVTSETEMLLIAGELAKNRSTGRVWVGMHFFSGRWLWTDGLRPGYEAWGGGEGGPACPDAGLECAALGAKGGSAGVVNTAAATGATLGLPAGTAVAGGAGQGAAAVGAAAADATENMWEAFNCEEKLHFVCY